MKRSIVYIIIFIILCSISNYSINYVQGKQIKEQSPYYLSFASIGAIYLESRLDCWAKIRTSSTKQELQDYLNNILQSLDMTLDPKLLTITSTDTTTILSYDLSRPEQNIIITIKSNKQLNESYLMLSIVCQDKKICLEQYESKLNQIIGLKWQYYYLYTGELPNMIALDDHNQVITVLLKTMKAQKVETYSNNGISSVTAFSSRLEGRIPGLSINGKSYNLQLAIRNNKDKAKTYVYIGSPLILGEY
ncbi:MAG: YwmB family TATA-box binding protein [Syntrophomonadaceae bacterium]